MPRIIMGNDEFILFIRKECIRKNNCTPISSTTILGKTIGDWLNKNINGLVQLNNEPCYWMSPDKDTPTPMGLPYTATQFEFEDIYLIDIYRFLSTLA